MLFGYDHLEAFFSFMQGVRASLRRPLESALALDPCQSHVFMNLYILGKDLKKQKAWGIPSSINTDKNPTYTTAIKELKAEGRRPEDVVHWQVKYLNNIIEADHGKLKRLIKPTLGFKD